jgi:hypothetical protein
MTQESKLQFALNMEEVELLTVEYWTDVIDYKWDRFSYPHEPISTNESESLRRALTRLDDIAAVIGDKHMDSLRKIALERFRSPFTTDEQWAAFMAYAPMFLRPVEVTL